MATEDAVGIQTRAMTEAQHTENKAQQNAASNQEEGQRTVQGTGEIAHDPAMNPVVEIHKTTTYSSRSTSNAKVELA